MPNVKHIFRLIPALSILILGQADSESVNADSWTDKK